MSIVVLFIFLLFLLPNESIFRRPINKLKSVYKFRTEYMTSCSLSSYPVDDNQILSSSDNIICKQGSKFYDYLHELIVSALFSWNGNESDKNVIGEKILKESIDYAEIRNTEKSVDTRRDFLREVIHAISKVIAMNEVNFLKSVDILELGHISIDVLFQNYVDNVDMNHKVFESITSHHSSIKEKNWTENVKDVENLVVYKDAAFIMGNKEWVVRGAEWMKNLTLDFFYNSTGISKKYLRKLKTSKNESFKKEDDKITMLDVGSCFNPFKKYYEFDVTAIDLCPADDSVYKCDFLSISVFDSTECSPSLHIDSQFKSSSDGTLAQLPKSYYDTVVMSLVLSYLPDPVSRLKMVQNARLVLSSSKQGSDRLEPGLLLIFEKDSILHKSKYFPTFLQHWKDTICGAGFELLKYENLMLSGHRGHAFAFVTTTDQIKGQHEGLWIKQDIQNNPSIDEEKFINEKLSRSIDQL